MVRKMTAKAVTLQVMIHLFDVRLFVGKKKSNVNAKRLKGNRFMACDKFLHFNFLNN